MNRNFLISALVMLVLSALGSWQALNSAGPYGFTYPVDDAYIHLAIARQVFESGSFCPQPGMFCLSSSSPGYSLLLALAGGPLGMPWWMPLLLNVLAALGLIYLLQASRIELEDVPNKTIQSTKVEVELLLLCLIPIPLLILNGMEHLWQLWANLWLCLSSVRVLKGKKALGSMGLAASLSVFFRYEGLFLAAALAFLFMLKRRFRESVLLLTTAILPVVVLGLYSLGRGGTFLPLTLLGKGNSPLDLGIFFWLKNGMEALYEHPFMLMLLCGLLFFIVVQKKGSQVFLAKAIALACLPQLWLAQVGGYRYEAWLIGLGLWLLLPAFWRYLKNKPNLSWALLAVWLFPFVMRALFFSINHGAAVRDIAFQHRATAAFLNTFYPKTAVALNDIGAVCYETNCTVTDINGIADQPVILAKRDGSYGPDWIDSLTNSRGVRIAALHEQFVADAIPPNWIRVGEWDLQTHFMTADPLLSWYAVDSSEAEKLAAALAEWDAMRRGRP
jgi:hypothetical protein